jgi:hypothetical protein
MRTLLRHTKTGLYLQGPEKWTTVPEHAFDFRFIERAQQFVRTWELEHIEIAFLFEDPTTVSTFSSRTVELKDAA